ncbi:tyrosine--tRNA ligase [Candidatus Woesearchaeota archaeon]|nr:tyrosine--tRNA ligase [Candidatus Woesearchaeota archaeon]
MDKQERIDLITRNTAEVIGEEQLPELLNEKELITYCGYETSGEIHLGHLVTVTKLMDLEKAGIKVKVLFADWHTWLNMKGDWQYVHDQVKQWQQGFKALGLKHPEFVLGSSFQRDLAYIDEMMHLAQTTTIKRALRSMQQVARDIEHAHISQVLYPLMQILDIKYLQVDIVHSGIEQRKIHMLGQEVFEPVLNYKKPVFVHTPLIPALQGSDEGKMSSSDKATLISIRDTKQDVKKKLNKAYCPAGEVKENPVLMIAQLVIFPRLKGKPFVIDRPEKFGGKLEYHSYDALERAYKDDLHPADLKQAVAHYLGEILEPVRKAFGLQ